MIGKNWNKINAICSIILATVAVLALVASVITSRNSDELSRQVIAMTPSKYAYIDSMQTDYFGNIIYEPIANVNNSMFDWSTRVNFNIINSGQLNTGNIQVSKRPELNSDNTFDLKDININDISSKGNDAFRLNFSLANNSNLLGLHQINLSINCPNCVGEGANGRIISTIYICVYNNSKYKYNSGLVEVFKSGCTIY